MITSNEELQRMTQPDIFVSAFSTITDRRSTRRFLPMPVPEESVYQILAAASRAPSGQNMQPWLVHYVTGDTRSRLSQEVTEAAERGERSDEYAYFPQQIREPYLARRRKVGYDLFVTYGVARDDLAGRKEAFLRNFDFFGAPVGLFFVMERDWGYGAWIDLGDERHDAGAGLRACHLRAAVVV
ncbi:MAG: nitroreductase family protein [Agrobacterium vaccinii]